MRYLYRCMTDGVSRRDQGTGLGSRNGHVLETQRSFSAFGESSHHRDRFHRIFSRGSFAAEHDSVRPIHDRIGHIRSFRPGRTGIRHHRLQHLGCCNYRFSSLITAPDQHFLDNRHVLGRYLNAQIATRHHDTIGDFQDLVDILDSGGVFNLGDDMALRTLGF